MGAWLPPSPLYCIVDAALAERRGLALEDLAAAYLDAGALVLQIRAKTMASAPLLAACEAVVARARETGACVIVNDRADLALLSGAAGVHVGQDDLSVQAVRRVVGDAAIVGLSTHTEEQIQDAAARPISYLAIGPVFGTESKDTGYAPVGLELVRRAAASGRPVVAIGGITLERAPAVLQAGASAVAVISDLLQGDPGSRVRAFLDALA